MKRVDETYAADRPVLQSVDNALIDHPAVKRINFTGSTDVGRMIAIRAAGQLKPVVLELVRRTHCYFLTSNCRR